MLKDQKDIQSESLQVTLISSNLTQDQLIEIIESNKKSLFVLEQIPTPQSNLFQPYTHLIENGYNLETLATEEELRKRYPLWVAMGSDFTLKEYDFMNALYYCSNCVDEDVPFRTIRRRIVESSSLSQEREGTYLKALYKAYLVTNDVTDTFVYGNNQQRDRLIAFFLNYDQKCIERFYKEKVKHIMESSEDKNIIIILNNKYIDAISSLIQNTNNRTNLPNTNKIRNEIKHLLDNRI